MGKETVSVRKSERNKVWSNEHSAASMVLTVLTLHPSKYIEHVKASSASDKES